MLIKVGDRTVNTDQVVEYIEYRSGGVDVATTIGRIRLLGDGAEAIRGWLREHASNLTPKSDDEREWAAFKESGGDATRPTWEKWRRTLRQLIRDQDESGYSEHRQARITELEVALKY